MFNCYTTEEKKQGDASAPKDNMMTKEQLYKMFANIGFTPTESQKEKYDKLFAIRDKITNSEFMTIFKIKGDDIPYSKSEVANAFKVYSNPSHTQFLSQEYKKPNHINKEKIRDVLKYLELSTEDIARIMHSIDGLADEDGDVDYKDLIESLY